MSTVVFYHLLRTGGSSIWASLWYSAAQDSKHHWDLYHTARTRFGDNRLVYKAVQYEQENSGRQPCVIHHHIPLAITPCTEVNTTATTIVREPIERFLSEVQHGMSLLAGEMDDVHKAGCISAENELLGSGWPAELIERVKRDHLSFLQTVEATQSYKHFNSYYQLWFARFCYPQLSALSYQETYEKLPSLADLATKIMRNFSYIGRFPDIQRATLAMARLAGLRCSGDQRWLNRRDKPPQCVSNKVDVTLFKSEYKLLGELGITFNTNATC